MKSLLFAAFALSLILVVSAQCNLNAAQSCVQDYINMLAGVTDPAEIERLTRNFCRSSCVTSTLPSCTSVQGVNEILQGCSALNGGPPSAGYSVFALLSSVILAGVAAVFY